MKLGVAYKKLSYGSHITTSGNNGQSVSFDYFCDDLIETVKKKGRVYCSVGSRTSDRIMPLLKEVIFFDPILCSSDFFSGEESYVCRCKIDTVKVFKSKSMVSDYELYSPLNINCDKGRAWFLFSEVEKVPLSSISNVLCSCNGVLYNKNYSSIDSNLLKDFIAESRKSNVYRQTYIV